MKYLGLDYGAKRIGVAVSNAEGTIAFPRTTIVNNPRAVDQLASIVVRERVEAIVAGDTRTLEGAENPITPAAETFAQKLADTCALPLHFAREAGSSVAVSSDEKPHDDAAAAAFVLQRYLDGVQ